MAQLVARVPDLLDVICPEVGVCQVMLGFLKPDDLCRISRVNTACHDAMNSPKINGIWQKHWETKYYIDPKFVKREYPLTPKQVFTSLMNLDISGIWEVSGTSIPDYVYSYMQRFKQTKRNGLHALVQGDVELKSQESFSVEGKMNGNTIIMHEAIVNNRNLNVASAVNICMAIISLDGSEMSGSWTQHAPSPRGLGSAIMSGSFLAKRVSDETDSLPVSAPPPIEVARPASPPREPPRERLFPDLDIPGDINVGRVPALRAVGPRVRNALERNAREDAERRRADRMERIRENEDILQRYLHERERNNRDN